MTHYMPLAVYMDVHVPSSASEGLRRKRIDVRTAQEDSAGRMPDEEMLARATALGRVLLTQDAELSLTGMTADEFRNRLVHLPLR